MSEDEQRTRHHEQLEHVEADCADIEDQLVVAEERVRRLRFQLAALYEDENQLRDQLGIHNNGTPLPDARGWLARLLRR